MYVIDQQQTQLELPQPGLALVAEGGGQRGAFTAGVLDSWLLAKFNPFEILIGTSAGAQNIASFLSKQTGYAYTLISSLTVKKEFFNPWRSLLGKNTLDLDWYFEQAQKNIYKFNCAQADKSSLNRKVLFSASTPFEPTTKLIDPTLKGWLEPLRLSSAIPFLYKSDSLIDGGVTAPLPVREAYELGATTIVTIRTNADSKNSTNDVIRKLKSVTCFKSRCLRFMQLFEAHEYALLKSEEFMKNPPENVRVIEIKPERELRAKALGSKAEDLRVDYKHGLKIGRQLIENNKLAQLSAEVACLRRGLGARLPSR